MDQLYDIYTTWHVPWWQQPMVRYACAALIVLLIIGCIVWAVVMRRRRARVLTPWQRAQLSLQQLHKTIGSQEPRLWYAQLIDTIKQYAYERYGLDVRSHTDEELLLTLQTVVTPDSYPAWQELVSGAVTAKFANAHAMSQQQHRDLMLCTTWVKNTVPLDDKR